MQAKFLSVLAIMALFTTTSCNAREEISLVNSKKIDKHLVKAEKGSSFTAAHLRKLFPLGPAELLIKHDVTTYRVTYKTTDQYGKEVTASGAMMIPAGADSFPLFNYNHGTIFPYDEDRAPSYLSDDGETEIGKMLASTGYVVMLPDYIGYGSSKDLEHPYCAYPLIAVTVVDMMKAVREFCTEKGVALKKDKNFFAGWSEGAGVTLGVVKLLEEQYASEFPVTAAAPMAGAYYSTKFADYVINSKSDLQFLRSYAWVLQSYNKVYGLNKPLDYYFNEPYASNLKRNPASYTTLDPDRLFTKKFRDDFNAGRVPDLQKAIEMNDLWNWKPKAKIILCHGEYDNYVPVFNSEKAYEAMKSKGADVKLVIYPGKGHSNSIKEYITTVFFNFTMMR
jgi:predicted esterase